jgi:YVTN family beta-propeller protein
VVRRCGGGSVWVSQRQVPGVVSRLDARSGKLQQRYSYTQPNLLSVDIAYGAGAAWAAANSIPGAQPGVLLRIDAVGGDAASIEVGGVPIGVGVGIGAVWVTDAQENGRVHRFDRFGRLATTIPVRRLPLGVTTGGGFVWVANAGETTVSQIDPRTNTVVDTIDTRYFPYGLVYGRGYLWVSLQGEPFNFE